MRPQASIARTCQVVRQAWNARGAFEFHYVALWCIDLAMFKLADLQAAAFAFVLEDRWLNIYIQMTGLQEAVCVMISDSVFHSMLKHTVITFAVTSIFGQSWQPIDRSTTCNPEYQAP